MISLSQLEQEILYMRMQGMYSDKNMRCEQLEHMMDSRLFLMQARIDSLSVNQEMVNSSLEQRMAQIQTNFGGDDEVETADGGHVAYPADAAADRIVDSGTYAS